MSCQSKCQTLNLLLCEFTLFKYNLRKPNQRNLHALKEHSRYNFFCFNVVFVFLVRVCSTIFSAGIEKAF